MPAKGHGQGGGHQGDQEPPGVLSPGARGDWYPAHAKHRVRSEGRTAHRADDGPLCAPVAPVHMLRGAEHQPVRAAAPEQLQGPLHVIGQGVPQAAARVPERAARRERDPLRPEAREHPDQVTGHG